MDDELLGQILLATRSSDLAQLQGILNQGKSTDYTLDDGTTPLHLAASENSSKEFIAFLLKNGIGNVNAIDEEDQTPLHIAAWQGNLPVCEILCKNGADVNLKQADGCTALHLAASHPKSWKICKVLVDSGADLDLTDEKSTTALHLCSWWGNINALKLLIKNGANIEAEDVDGLRPIHYACYSENSTFEVVKTLIEKNAKVNVTNGGGITPLHMAAGNKKPEVCKLLIDNLNPVDILDAHRLYPEILSQCGGKATNRVQIQSDKDQLEELLDSENFDGAYELAYKMANTFVFQDDDVYLWKDFHRKLGMRDKYYAPLYPVGITHSLIEAIVMDRIKAAMMKNDYKLENKETVEKPLECIIEAECDDDPLYEKDGILCTRRHFICNECLNGYIRMQATELSSDGKVRCPEDGCKSRGYTDKAIAMRVTDQVFEELIVGRQKLREASTAATIEEIVARRVEEEIERRIRAENEFDERVKEASEHITENILSLKCPRCRLVFVDFNGCAALSCDRNGCKAKFCAYCLTDTGDDDNICHDHVRNCPEGGRKLFPDNWDETMKLRTTARVKEYLRELSNREEGLMEAVFEVVDKPLRDLKIFLPRPKRLKKFDPKRRLLRGRTYDEESDFGPRKRTPLRTRWRGFKRRFFSKEKAIPAEAPEEVVIREHPEDAHLVRLMDMGFDLARAQLALNNNNGNVEEAIEELFR